MPRVTTVEAAAEPPEVPPATPVAPELAAPFCAPEVFDVAASPPLEVAPDVLSPEGVAVLTLSEAVAAEVTLAALAFSSSCVLPPLMASWIVLSRLALPVFVTLSGRLLKLASDLTEIEAL